jgi:hypothetical protein
MTARARKSRRHEKMIIVLVLPFISSLEKRSGTVVDFGQ